MKRLIVIFSLAIFLLGTAPVTAIDKVPKSSSNETVVQKKDSSDQKKFPTKQNEQQKKDIKKDIFIDRDGDGINDKVSKSKPPEIKKPVIRKTPKKEQVKSPAKSPKPSKDVDSDKSPKRKK